MGEPTTSRPEPLPERIRVAIEAVLRGVVPDGPGTGTGISKDEALGYAADLAEWVNATRACDCCEQNVPLASGHQHPTDDTWVCDACFWSLATAALRARADTAEADRVAWMDAAIRREADLRTAEAEVERLRDALAAARVEIDRWGYGDHHYGATPRDPSVLAALAAIDAALEPDTGRSEDSAPGS